MNGLWQSRGYGWLLHIEDDRYSLAHVTAKNCIPAEKGTRAEFQKSFDRIDLSRDGVLSLHQAGDLTRYTFDRLAAPPDVAVITPGTMGDAAVNFETLWQTFDEHYAFFGLHVVDWQEEYRRYRPRVTPMLSEDALLEVFSEMLLPLEDGHVSLSAGDRHVQTLKMMELRLAFKKALGLPNARVSPRTTVEAMSPKIADLLLAPFASTRDELKQAGNGIVSWCRLKDGVGYVSVLRLFGFADTDAARRADDLPHTRQAVAEFLANDMAALEPILDRVVADLHDCRAIILDLRINGGGFDRAGLAIASRFADQPRVAFTKRARDGAAFTQTQEMRLSAAERRFDDKPVYVLTSPLCVSAGEICVLAMRALPQVTTIGQATAGMLSDNLNKLLPNGWQLSLSNEVYTSHDGKVFEGCGIAPDEPSGLDTRDFAASMQAQLQHVVSRIA